MKSTLLVLTLALVFAGCSTPSETADITLPVVTDGMVSGTVTYRQRIAIPDDAQVVVELIDVTRYPDRNTAIGSRLIPTEGRQVPIPFAVTYDPAIINHEHEYVLVARIRSSDETVLFKTVEDHTIELSSTQIDGVTVVVQPVEGEETGSNVNPWDDAAQRGVAFRAVGNEPGWFVEVTEGEHILAVTDYGEHRAMTPYVEPRDTDEGMIFHAETEATILTLVVQPGPCFDSMSGVELETNASLTLNGANFRGCGKWL